MPFSVLDYGDFNNTGEFYERPDLVGNPFAGSSGPANYLNLSAFAAPCANPDVADEACNGGAHFGSSPRNGFYGPHYRNFDFSLTKDTKLTEHVNMQLRADFFNLFNHPNFANPLLPSFNVLWDNNGVDPTGHGVGFFPLTVTPDVGAQNPFLGGRWPARHPGSRSVLVLSGTGFLYQLLPQLAGGAFFRHHSSIVRSDFPRFP